MAQHYPMVMPETWAADQIHIRMLNLQCIDINRDWQAANVLSTYWRLYVNNRDGASVQLPTGPYPLARGRIHLIPAWVLFTCRCTRTIGHLYAHFDMVGVPGALVRQVFDAPVTLPRLPRLEAHAADLAAALKNRIADAPVMLAGKALVYQALATVIDALPAAKAARLSSSAIAQSRVSPALQYIEAHLHQSLRNGDLAALCHLSEDHFIRLFRRDVGQTPAQYILERRIGLASQQLVFTGDKIDAIAEATGFPDRFYFTRVFTRVMGVSPAAYRRTAGV